MTGLVNYLAGHAAEDAVAADYARRGHAIVARCWRGTRGEIDLVAQDGDGFIFIEVKKSRYFARAAQHLTAAQVRRIYGAAEEFVADKPKGQLTDMRFDVALVDGHGQMQIIENAQAF